MSCNMRSSSDRTSISARRVAKNCRMRRAMLGAGAVFANELMVSGFFGLQAGADVVQSAHAATAFPSIRPNSIAHTHGFETQGARLPLI